MDLSFLQGKLLRGDRFLYGAMGVLVLVSLLAVFSSTTALTYQNHRDQSYFLLQHAKMLFLAVVCMVSFSQIKPRRFFEFAPLVLLLSIGAVAMTWVAGASINGSSRWLKVMGLQFQPSEIAKYAMILFAANQFSKYQKEPQRAFKHVLVALIVVLAFIVPQNLSTGVLIGASTSVMFLIGRAPMKPLFLLLVAIVGLASVAYASKDVVIKYVPRAETWFNRIHRFNSDEDGLPGNEQAEQAIAAVSIGGPLGVGPGHSYLKNILPMAYSDFIFSIILEEYGFFGMIVIMACYLIIIGRARHLASATKQPFNIYLIFGFATVICFQALINMAVGVGVIPVTGQTLPMVSMGGTSNCMTGLVFGMMLSVSQEIIDEAHVPA